MSSIVGQISYLIEILRFLALYLLLPELLNQLLDLFCRIMPETPDSRHSRAHAYTEIVGYLCDGPYFFNINFVAFFRKIYFSHNLKLWQLFTLRYCQTQPLRKPLERSAEGERIGFPLTVGC